MSLTRKTKNLCHLAPAVGCILLQSHTLVARADNQLDLYVDIPVNSTVAQTRAAIDTLVANSKANGVRRLIPSLSRADGSVMWNTPLEQSDTQRTAQLSQRHVAL